MIIANIFLLKKSEERKPIEIAFVLCIVVTKNETNPMHDSTRLKNIFRIYKKKNLLMHCRAICLWKLTQINAIHCCCTSEQQAIQKNRRVKKAQLNCGNSYCLFVSNIFVENTHLKAKQFDGSQPRKRMTWSPLTQHSFKISPQKNKWTLGKQQQKQTEKVLSG